MAYYFVATYDVTDPTKYQEYIKGTVPLMMEYEGEAIVVSNDHDTIEGDHRNTTVVLRFPDEDAARGWYNDPRYEEVRKKRFEATENGTASFCSQFTPPS